MSHKTRIREATAKARERRELESKLPDPSTRRRIREWARLTQEEVGVAIGVSRQAVARYEAGDRTPSEGTSQRYIELLDGLRGGHDA
jgi:DNA-binding XRE family transcriptional regulator